MPREQAYSRWRCTYCDIEFDHEEDARDHEMLYCAESPMGKLQAQVAELESRVVALEAVVQPSAPKTKRPR